MEPVRTNVRDLIIVLIAMVGGIVFCSGTMANNDPLWFLPFFNETPSSIIFYRAGCRVDLVPGQPSFDEVTRALNETLSQIDGYDPTYGLSPDSLRDYRGKERALEIFYARRIRIHVPFRFGDPDTLFIPLSGQFATTRSMFGGYAADYWASALRLKSLDALQRAVEPIRCTR